MNLLRRLNFNRKLTYLVFIPPVVGLLAIAGLLLAGSFQEGPTGTVQAQVGTPDHSTMDQRLNQLINSLQPGRPDAAQAALDSALDILYGGLRPLPSAGEQLEATEEVHRAISAAELRLAGALQEFSLEAPEPLAAQAINLKFFIEEMNEVAAAVGNVTRQCTVDMSLQEEPCDNLLPLLDEDTGEVRSESAPPTGITVLRPSFSVKLRSPIVPMGFTPRWEEDVQLTEPLAPGQCSAVFKETRGLMLRLHLDRITVVTDPWVNVFNFPRGTRVPIWRLEWVPSEYIKTFHICNVNGQTSTRVQQLVKQDRPLNFFWRFYEAPGKSSKGY